jgi:hypothetical protein
MALFGLVWPSFAHFPPSPRIAREFSSGTIFRMRSLPITRFGLFHMPQDEPPQTADSMTGLATALASWALEMGLEAKREAKSHGVRLLGPFGKWIWQH